MSSAVLVVPAIWGTSLEAAPVLDADGAVEEPDADELPEELF